MIRHAIERRRFEPKRRDVAVASVAALTPRMLRITFAGEALGDFASAAADDHVKMFFPVTGTGEYVGRDFTPRAFDAAAGTLTVDFAMHPSGPAIAWARSAKPGDRLAIGGPRGSAVVPDDFDWYLLVGDETALPAIGRRIEELRPGVPVRTLVVVDADADRQTFDTPAALEAHWCVRRAGTDDAALLRDALWGLPLPPGEGFIWIAAEADVARTLRAYVLERGHNREWVKAAGYWKRGSDGAHERIED